MNETQTIFTVFYAIFWGLVANVQPRWKAFQWPLIFDLKQARYRVALSFMLLNICPVVFFGLIIWFLSGPKLVDSSWTGKIAFRFVCRGVIPAFAAFGFYRVWLGIIEINPKNCFYNQRQSELPEKYRGVTGEGHEIEPTVEGLGIKQNTHWKNILFGIIYIILGLLPLYYQ